MTLALEYRPKRFEEIVGQKPVRLVLQQMIKQGKLPPALLFTGSRGTGKTTTGRVLAAALNCEHDDKPCGSCVYCKGIFDGISPDVLEIDAASNGLVDDIRQLRDMVMYSTGGDFRVVLLDEAHSMQRAAFNALLKVLEEPPPQTVFVLLTTEPAKILETVVSRCMTFEFRRISARDIQARLEVIARQEGLYPSGEVEASQYAALLARIAERANGGMRDAVMELDQVSRVGVRTVDQLAKLMGDIDYAPELFKAMLHQDVSSVYEQVDELMVRFGDPSAVSSELVKLLRDLMVVKAGGCIVVQGEALQRRQELAAMVDSDRLVAAMRVLWDLKTRVRVVEDGRAMLELAVVMLSEALRVKVETNGHAQPTRKLSLQEMKEMANARTSA